MPAETVETYTYKPTIRSTFTPNPEEKQGEDGNKKLPADKKTGLNTIEPVK